MDVLQLVFGEGFALGFGAATAMMAVRANANAVCVTSAAFSVVDTLLGGAVNLQFDVWHVVLHMVSCALLCRHKGIAASAVPAVGILTLHLNLRQAAAMLFVIGAVSHATFQTSHKILLLSFIRCKTHLALVCANFFGLFPCCCCESISIVVQYRYETERLDGNEKTTVPFAVRRGADGRADGLRRGKNFHKRREPFGYFRHLGVIQQG